jgi:hypothetical protein
VEVVPPVLSQAFPSGEDFAAHVTRERAGRGMHMLYVMSEFPLRRDRFATHLADEGRIGCV